MPRHRPALFAIALAGIGIVLASAPANADGMPLRGVRGAVDVEMQNGVRIWRPRPYAVRGARAPGVTAEGLTAHMLAGHLFRPPSIGVAVVPADTPYYVGGGGSRFFAPAPYRAGRQVLRTGPLIGSSSMAGHRAAGGFARAAPKSRSR
jgi:hypothetical protein